MAFGLIGAGLQIAQTVGGIVGAAKGGKKDKAAAEEGGAAQERKAAKKDEKNPMDRFREKIRGLTDPKQIDALKDEILQTLHKKMPGKKHADARQKITKEIEERVKWRKLQLAGKVPAHIHDRDEQINGPKPAQAPQPAHPPPAAAANQARA